MNETHCYLISNNIHNFRHGKGSPIIIGVCTVTPKNLHPRPCYKVLHNDGMVDYVPLESIEDGDYHVSMTRVK